MNYIFGTLRVLRGSQVKASSPGKELFLLLFLLASPSFAADWYVRPTASGSNTGRDWSNAWSLSGIGWANVNAGDTIWLAGGTYTGSLNIQKSGSAGNYISVKRVRATDANPAAAPGWSPGFDSQVVVAPTDNLPCTWLGGSGLGSYVMIDGRVTDGISFRLANIQPAAYPGCIYFGSSVNGTHDIILTNLDLVGPATPGAVVSYLPYNSGCLVFRGGPYAGDGIYVSNILVSHCNLHANTDLLTIIGVQHAIFEYCNFYDCEFDSSPVSNHPNLDMQAFSGDIHFRYCRFWNWVSEGIMLGAATEPSPHPWGPTYFYGCVFESPNDGTYAARVVEARWHIQTGVLLQQHLREFGWELYGLQRGAGRRPVVIFISSKKQYLLELEHQLSPGRHGL